MSSSGTVADYASGGRLSTEESSDGLRCIPDDSITELRSCGQVENGTPSTSPPFWDEDDDDRGPKPSALYGKFTWKIEKYSQNNKRELRSNAFEVGGFKWYILIYPQGCDVCNHLSLFLCVANHEKLLPGWSHFAQFTIAVVNKDPKKSKYSDTLHRFCKKEHDWGWKKFIETSKVLDGFINDDSLVIKAQVQVLREKAHRPFRCLDCQYRRELVRVYLSNVEIICRRFIEDRKGKLSKLFEDKMRWSSFSTFWSEEDSIAKQRMSRAKTDAILKGVIKHFFIEKEVTSTLVMDSLYSGLKALEYQSKDKKGKTKLVEGEELPAPIVYSENDMFVLSDDVLKLLERVAVEPVPLLPLTPKDDKGSQNRIKDVSSGEEFNKDSIERDERHLTEFGRRTLEYFVLAHIFSRVEVAYQEAVALKRQEDLIREEEAAEQAEYELKVKRSAADKEKRAKKKQAKQRRNSRQGKERARDEKSDLMMQDKHQEQSPSDKILLEEISSKEEPIVLEKFCSSANASDMSDVGDDVAEPVQPDLEDGGCNFAIQGGHNEKRTTSVVDDSSSTCSTDSIPSVVIRSQKGNSLHDSRSPNRGKNQLGKDPQNQPPDDNHLSGTNGSCGSPKPETEVAITLNDGTQFFEQHIVDKEKELNAKDQVHISQPSISMVADTPSALGTPKQSSQNGTAAATAATTTTVKAVLIKESHSTSIRASSTTSIYKATRSPQVSSSKSEAEKHPTPTKISTSLKQTTSKSRPSSAPLIPPPRPTVPMQVPPLLSRSISVSGQLGSEPSPSAPAFIPHSYINAITGTNDTGSIPAGFAYHPSSLTFGSMKSERLQSQHHPRAMTPSSVTMPADEFPHLDIIYDLLDDDKNLEAADLHYYNNYPHNPNHIETEQFYNERVYGSSSAAAFTSLDNGQSQGLIQNRWNYSNPNQSVLNLGDSYQLRDYTNGVNGNIYARPRNGH